MRLNPRDDAGLSGAKAPFGESAPGATPGNVSIPSSRPIRSRYVVGVFGRATGIDGAIAGLARATCPVLILLGSRSRHKTTVNQSNERMTLCALDTSEPLPVKLADALASFPPFAALEWPLCEPQGQHVAPPGLQRLFQNIVQHLASGATITIAHVPNPECQLQISRVLLEAKCDVLLTHDVLQTSTYAPPEAAESTPRYDDGAALSRAGADAERNGTVRSNG